jgi:hypothetical protein
MDRARRVGRNVFDIDPDALAKPALPVAGTAFENGAQFLPPDARIKADVDEAGARDVRALNRVERG